MLVAALTRWVLRHKTLVVIVWLGLTAAGAASAPRAVAAMSSDVGSLPGRPGYEANQEIRRVYGTGGDANPLVLVVQLPHGTTVDAPGVRAELATAVSDAARAVGGARAASYADGADRGFVSADGRTTFALLYPPPGPGFPAYTTLLPRLNQALDGIRVGGSPVHLTGTDVLFAQSSKAEGPGVLAETVVGGLGALVVLTVVFGSLLAAVPLVMAAIAILVTFLAVWGLTAITEVSFVVQFLVALIGLGVAIDHTLLVVLRWREERAWGLANEQAVEHAMATAGVAVVVSGTTVAISLAVLLLVPVPFLRSMGYGGLEAATEHLGGPGDQGLDGLIRQDLLGLDVVYVQAKRYATDRKIGRPDIQGFVGALHGAQASRGIFITTSSFSADARIYAERVNARIVLIDGPELAQLMVQHNCGVRVEDTFVLKEVDEDFFDES